MGKFLKITLTLFISIMLILGFVLPLNMPPGWFQQTLPENDFVNDIFFIDTSNGWLVTQGQFPTNDTSYIMHTTNGGNSWVIRIKNRENLNVVQFVNLNIGYAGGGINGSTNTTIYKTTNSGINWTSLNNLGGIQINDMHFVNKDTGWVCDNNFTFGAGLQKTTNGGASWFQQLPRTYRPTILFFLNNDTGWMGGSLASGAPPRELYRTTNGGINWTLMYTFSEQFFDICFFNINVGVVTAATFNQRTTNGGINWTLTNEPGNKLSFVNDSVGWAGYGSFIIMKTRNGGQTWYRQTTPIFNATRVCAVDTSVAWACGGGVIHTTDGGGPTGIQQIGSEIPSSYMLFQNYPNPFNPVTNIKYQISKNNSEVMISLFDLTGKHLIDIVNGKQSAGIYLVDWDASDYASGVYFYKLTVSNGKEVFTETKKMLFIK